MVCLWFIFPISHEKDSPPQFSEMNLQFLCCSSLPVPVLQRSTEPEVPAAISSSCRVPAVNNSRATAVLFSRAAAVLAPLTWVSLNMVFHPGATPYVLRVIYFTVIVTMCAVWLISFSQPNYGWKHFLKPEKNMFTKSKLHGHSLATKWQCTSGQHNSSRIWRLSLLLSFHLSFSGFSCREFLL